MGQPSLVDTSMFAPCGMNCSVCYKHLKIKNACVGCMNGDAGKTEHCITCKIKACAISKEKTYCFECESFPCKSIKSLDISYIKRYGVSLVENSVIVKAEGLEAFMIKEKARWTCKACGGVISLHDAECSKCHLKGKEL